MDISSLCHRDIVSVSANASVREAAQIMRQHHVGALVVTDADEPGRAIGVVTDRNLVVDLLAQGLPPEGRTIGTLCSTSLIGVPSTATLPEAVQEMRRAGVRRLLVVRPGGELVGLVSADDLFEAIAGQLESLAGALRSGIAQESLRTTHDAPRFDIPRAVYLPGHEP